MLTLTRRERLKSARYLMLKKRRRLFLEKNFAEKCKRGALRAQLTYILFQNIKKTRKEDSFETLKNFRKKIEREDPLVSSGFVGYV